MFQLCIIDILQLIWNFLIYTRKVLGTLIPPLHNIEKDQKMNYVVPITCFSEIG